MIKELKSTIREFEDKVETILNCYVKKYQTVPIGTRFTYKGEECEVKGASFRYDAEQINQEFLWGYEERPELDIVYLIDIPSWREVGLVCWCQGVLERELNNES